MASHLTMPNYTSKDLPIMLGSMIPMTLLVNYFLFGSRYFQDSRVFVWATLVGIVLHCLAFIGYGKIAVGLRNRFPSEGDLYKRLAICITLFILMTGVYLSIVCKGFELFRFLGYEFDEVGFSRAYATLVVLNIFLIFVHEGVSTFESYKQTITETEQLKKTYMESQLLGLKSQVNPHFLFNSLNTLSSLIHEDADIAEDFLDHMSKVYRYLLRNNDDQLVPLATEMNFMQSYGFLLKARHGDALSFETEVSEGAREYTLPPLTLQMIVENAVYQNTISRDHPLRIRIYDEGGQLIVWNNVQPKMSNTLDTEGLDNIRKKYRLLGPGVVEIMQSKTERKIRLPLLPKKEEIKA